MRAINFGRPLGRDTESRLRYLEEGLKTIAIASNETEVPAYAKDYRVTSVSELREFDASSATLEELRAVVGTLLQDMRRANARST